MNTEKHDMILEEIDTFVFNLQENVFGLSSEIGQVLEYALGETLTHQTLDKSKLDILPMPIKKKILLLNEQALEVDPYFNLL